MAILASTSANSSTNSLSLSQKLRDLGRLKSRSDERLEKKKDFDIVHTPDRPTRLVSPVEAPSEDECGELIARWQRASARERTGGMFTRGQYGTPDAVGQRPLAHLDRRLGGEERYGLPVSALTRLDRQNYSVATTDSDEDEGGRVRHDRVTRLAHGKEVGRSHGQQTGLRHGQPLWPAPQEAPRAEETGYGTQQQQSRAGTTGYHQHGSARANYAAVKASPIPSPLFSGTARPLPPTSHPRSVGPAMATIAGGKSIAQPRYTGGRYSDTDADEDPVDIATSAHGHIPPRILPLLPQVLWEPPLTPGMSVPGLPAGLEGVPAVS